ncbi:hypothetical protein ABG768_013909, partial [Culter alburnus]
HHKATRGDKEQQVISQEKERDREIEKKTQRSTGGKNAEDELTEREGTALTNVGRKSHNREDVDHPVVRGQKSTTSVSSDVSLGIPHDLLQNTRYDRKSGADLSRSV